MQDSVYSNLPQAKLGGIPGKNLFPLPPYMVMFIHPCFIGTLKLVNSFLHLRGVVNMPGLEDECVGGQPVWALVFYCVRCGSLEDALEAITHAS